MKAAVGSRAVYSRLYEALWQPIEAWLPSVPGARVAVIPHGPLLALPFGALRDRSGNYLVEVLAPLRGQWGRLARRARQDGATGRCDAGASGRRPRAGPLWCRCELRFAAGCSPRSGVDRADACRLRRRPRGGTTSETAVRAALPTARVAHFATHALVDAADPLGSHLVLGATANAATQDHDGRLTASEVAGMTLDGELVVLAACRSARGPDLERRMPASPAPSRAPVSRPSSRRSGTSATAPPRAWSTASIASGPRARRPTPHCVPRSSRSSAICGPAASPRTPAARASRTSVALGRADFDWYS